MLIPMGLFTRQSSSVQLAKQTEYSSLQQLQLREPVCHIGSHPEAVTFRLYRLYSSKAGTQFNDPAG